MARTAGLADADEGDIAYLCERVAEFEAGWDAALREADAAHDEARALRERVATLTAALAFIDQEADHQMERAYAEQRGRQGTAFHHLRNVARVALAGAADTARAAGSGGGG